MSNYRKQLLTEVCTLCQQLLTKRVALARTQNRVSDTARINAIALQDGYTRIVLLSPFPQKGDVDEGPLTQLKTALSDPDSDAEDRENILLNWLKNIAPPPAAAATETDGTTVTISPINQRMLDATAQLRKTIDSTRIRLMTSGDNYDKAAYKAARNDFTLTRAAFDRRLENDQTDVTVEDAKRVETILQPAIKGATGATFPTTIQDAADFMRDRTFVLV